MNGKDLSQQGFMRKICYEIHDLHGTVRDTVWIRGGRPVPRAVRRPISYAITDIIATTIRALP